MLEKAGGQKFETPAFIMEEHNIFKPVNLKTGEHIKHNKEFSDLFDK